MTFNDIRDNYADAVPATPKEDRSFILTLLIIGASGGLSFLGMGFLAWLGWVWAHHLAGGCR